MLAELAAINEIELIEIECPNRVDNRGKEEPLDSPLPPNRKPLT